MKHLIFLPDASLPCVLCSPPVMFVLDYLTHVDELELELDAVCLYCLVSVDVNRSYDRVLSIESAHVTFEND